MTSTHRARTFVACLLLSAVLPLGADDAPAKKRFSVDDFEKIVRLSSPRISPDGKRIAVVVIRADVAKNKWLPELNLVDVSTGAIRPLTHDRKGVSHPRWSPSGDQLAFLAADGAGKDAKPQIFVLPMAGGEAQKVTSAPTGVQHFAWRPDGKAFAFAAEDERPNKAQIEKGNDLFEVGSDSLYVSEAAMPVHVWLVPAEGGEAKRLTSGLDGGGRTASRRTASSSCLRVSRPARRCRSSSTFTAGPRPRRRAPSRPRPTSSRRRAGPSFRRTTGGATTAGTPTSARSSTTRATAPAATSSRAWTRS